MCLQEQQTDGCRHYAGRLLGNQVWAVLMWACFSYWCNKCSKKWALIITIMHWLSMFSIFDKHNKSLGIIMQSLFFLPASANILYHQTSIKNTVSIVRLWTFRFPFCSLTLSLRSSSQLHRDMSDTLKGSHTGFRLFLITCWMRTTAHQNPDNKNSFQTLPLRGGLFSTHKVLTIKRLHNCSWHMNKNNKPSALHTGYSQ